MTITSSQPKTYSAEEYLHLDVGSELRHEYHHGEIIPMPGGTPAHNEIIRMLVFLLTANLRKQPYSIFVTDQRLWIPTRAIGPEETDELYTYPNVMVTSRPVTLKPGRKDTVINPILIAEVLSDSTQGYDRGDKFAAYRTIPTFEEYLLIDQSKPHVEQYGKQAENQWLFTEYYGLDQTLNLQSVGVAIALTDLYEAIDW